MLERSPALMMSTWLRTGTVLGVAPRPANEQGLGENSSLLVTRNL